MSSLAAARADNYYYPQEWRPEHGSINKFHGSHPLGKRAKDIADGILVVRFEMPFNVWCTNCELHIGKGVRFNAKKKHAGMYFSTRTYEFSMNCTRCQHEMVIRTDPKERGYAMVSGIRQRQEGFSHEQTETESLNDDSLGLKLAQDPFFRLEHEQDDRRTAKKRSRGVEAMLELNAAEFRDDYASNAALRASFRKQKHCLQQEKNQAESLCLGMPLVPVQREDIIAAKSVVFQRIPTSHKKRCFAHCTAQDPKNSTRRDRTSGKSKRRELSLRTSDSFAHFGDSSLESQLHRLRKAHKQWRRGK